MLRIPCSYHTEQGLFQEEIAETIQNAEAFWDGPEPLIQDWDREHVVKVGKSNHR